MIYLSGLWSCSRVLISAVRLGNDPDVTKHWWVHSLPSKEANERVTCVVNASTFRFSTSLVPLRTSSGRDTPFRQPWST